LQACNLGDNVFDVVATFAWVQDDFHAPISREKSNLQSMKTIFLGE
jgi:hypothetical protein